MIEAEIGTRIARIIRIFAELCDENRHLSWLFPCHLRTDLEHDRESAIPSEESCGVQLQSR